jgi:hypothetical protein
MIGGHGSLNLVAHCLANPFLDDHLRLLDDKIDGAGFLIGGKEGIAVLIRQLAARVALPTFRMLHKYHFNQGEQFHSVSEGPLHARVPMELYGTEAQCEGTPVKISWPNCVRPMSQVLSILAMLSASHRDNKFDHRSNQSAADHQIPSLASVDGIGGHRLLVRDGKLRGLCFV